MENCLRKRIINNILNKMEKQKTYKVNATIFLKSGGKIAHTEIIKSFGELKENDLGVKKGWKYDKMIINSIEEEK